MPLPITYLEPGKIYHIYNHANGNENLFINDENYRYFLEKYILHISSFVNTFAYCLMPNHFHLMIQIKEKYEVLAILKSEKKVFNEIETIEEFSGIISKRFSNLFNGYTQAYNRRFNRKGSLFMPNFRRKLIEKEDYYSKCIAYIHLNPVNHGFVKDINDWPHSSWHAYLSSRTTKIDREKGINWFGNKKEFLKFHEDFPPSRPSKGLEPLKG